LPNQQGALTATTADGPEISPKGDILPWKPSKFKSVPGPDHGAFLNVPARREDQVPRHSRVLLPGTQKSVVFGSRLHKLLHGPVIALLFFLLVKLPLFAAIVAGS